MNNQTTNTEETVTGFSENWLTLREPFDHVARSPLLAEKLLALCKPEQPIRILDLGCGTGSNLRYLLPRLGQQQHWTLVDNDAQLLDALPSIMKRWSDANAVQITLNGSTIELHSEKYSATIERMVCDIANQLPALPVSTSQLVTGSALLDLTSSHWIDHLIRLCVTANCATLFALNYDGQIRWTPSLPLDELTLQQLNQHQLRDKGFGAALGPRAGDYFITQLKTSDCTVFKASSDWSIPCNAQDMQLALLDGWAQAVTDQCQQQLPDIELWQHNRKKQIAAAESSLLVGHIDILSLPAHS